MKQTLPLFVLIVISTLVLANSKQATEQVRVVCYNVENLFDCVDDSLTNDSEYLKGGVRNWNNHRYETKLGQIAKVIANLSTWTPPALIGLCEIESKKCLLDLTTRSPLKPLQYRFIHFESPDSRGVDVALLYQPKQFEPVYAAPIAVQFPFSTSTTRDVLYCKGTILQVDTLHLFVCHLPSRLSGEAETAERRHFVASLIRQHTDSIMHLNPSASILIMGDFNDYPTNKSLTEALGAKPLTETNTNLYNLFYAHQLRGEGTHKHQANWGCLDQIIVSAPMLSSANTLYTSQESAHIFAPNWLLTQDQTHLGVMPNRTYVGMQYNGGFSDHLPIYIDISVIKQ